MRYYNFVEQGDDGVTPVYVRMSEQEIIEFYWEWWSGKMREAGKPEEKITRENCIDDFCVVHWATPEKSAWREMKENYE